MQDEESINAYPGLTGLEARPEAELIEQVRLGNKNAFRPLVLAYQDKIYSIIVRQLANDSLAEELTQETFLRAYQNINSFRGESLFSTWIVRIAINLTHSYYSSKGYKQSVRTEYLDQVKYSEAFSSRQTDSYDSEAIARLKTLASGLSPKLREVFTLCAFEQKSYKEVADILAIPVGTVRSRLHKARLQIKRLYFEEE